MARIETLISVVYSFTVLALLTGLTADGSVPPKQAEKLFRALSRKDREVKQQWRQQPQQQPQQQQQQPQPQPQQQQQQQLHTSALNSVLAFDLYRDLATKANAEQQQQHNILFSPLGLASALALLSQISGSDSRSQALEALGLAANSTEQSAEATISALTDLQRSLTLQEGTSGGGIGATAGAEPEGVKAGNRTEVDNGAVDGTGTEDGIHVGGQLRLWSSLQADGKPSTDYDSFLSRPQHAGPSTFNVSFETLTKDLQTSDKLILNNYVYFKGHQPFDRRHTVPRSFKPNATTSVEAAMMFKDDSSEVMMLYDTNCSATVVRLAHSKRVASLLLLPKAELKPLEDCLSDSRMRFWLRNLKHGRAEIRFPKFQLRKSHSLESLLRNSGVSSVFSHSADFSGLSPKKTLQLIKAPHVVALEVEESKSVDGRKSDVILDFSIPQRITFDRPFMLIIYDEVTGLVLIMGRVIDPIDV